MNGEVRVGALAHLGPWQGSTPSHCQCRPARRLHPRWRRAPSFRFEPSPTTWDDGKEETAREPLPIADVLPGHGAVKACSTLTPCLYDHMRRRSMRGCIRLSRVRGAGTALDQPLSAEMRSMDPAGTQTSRVPLLPRDEIHLLRQTEPSTDNPTSSRSRIFPFL